MHVDVVENDWLGGRQQVVARITASAGHLEFESPDEVKWRKLLIPLELDDAARKGKLTPDAADRLLNELSGRYTGTYLFATEPHDDAGCPFPNRSAHLVAARKPRSAAQSKLKGR
jgi:hypothetical protein